MPDRVVSVSLEQKAGSVSTLFLPSPPSSFQPDHFLCRVAVLTQGVNMGRALLETAHLQQINSCEESS